MPDPRLNFDNMNFTVESSRKVGHMIEFDFTLKSRSVRMYDEVIFMGLPCVVRSVSRVNHTPNQEAVIITRELRAKTVEEALDAL